jgi:hypothetical protein
MDEPTVILSNGTRVRTTVEAKHAPDAERGLLIEPRHLVVRRPNAAGVICGFVAGHGGDVYWVAHLGDPCTAAYGWWEFELELPKYPCGACNGHGMDEAASRAARCWMPCIACDGKGEARAVAISLDVG